jgi:hypothetical protein
MAGPYTGTWRRSATSDARYTGALKWGTGINPVHSEAGVGPALIDPKLNYDTPDLGAGDDAARMIDDQFWPPPPDEEGDNNSQFWGYGQEGDLRDHPNYQEVGDANTAGSRAELNQPNWPPWGGSRKTAPGGTFIRSLLHGALTVNKSRQVPSETVSEGWENKAHGIAANSLPSDDSQLIMQTSMTQRYKVRAGSQSAGRASEYSAPVSSRVTGQKLKIYSGQERHYDMTPYDQDEILRGFLSRQAGTGYTEWQHPNEMFVNEPMQREPAPDPFQGTASPASSVPADYTSEDMQYYG